MAKKSSRPLLSVCIPAYNGGKYLVENLESIISQYLKDVEIVVADDQSTDDTFKLASSYKERYPSYNIKVFKNKKNLGFDRNVLNVISKATGAFCWLLGQDDKLLPDSLKTILSGIREHPNASLVYCNYTRYDNILKKITSEVMINIKKDRVFKDYNEFFFYRVHESYFQYLGTNVITMSTDVVNRKLWNKVEPIGRVGVGHNFIHCFMIAKIIRDNPYIVYFGKPQLWYRSNNHRFWPNDIWKDYNKVFIDFLIKMGYDGKKALDMRKSQKKFEKREAATKHVVLKHVYKFAKPAIGFARLIRSTLFIK